MTDPITSDSFSAKDLNENVDTFEDVPDAPKHPDDTFDPAEHLALLREAAKMDTEAGR